MAYIVRMPKLGVEMQTGVLLEWFFEEGESVDESDVLAEIESEKTVAEVTAREDGVFRRAVLEEGGEVEPGSPMGIVAGADEDIDDLLSTIESEGTTVESEPASADEEAGDERSEPADGPADSDRTAAASSESVRATPKAKQLARERDRPLEGLSGTGPKGAITVDDVERAVTGGTSPAAPVQPGAAAEAGEPDLVTPRARKRAAELDVPLGAVSGTGPHGSVRAGDVEAAAEGGVASVAASSEPPATTDSPSEPMTTETLTVREERPLSGMRSTIARRLSGSWEAPHVTVDRWVDAEAMLEAADEAGDVVSITDILLAAVSETLAAHPEFNATFDGETHTLYEEHNVGFAVDVEAGLVTPVLRDIEPMSVTELAHQRGALTDRVLNQRYSSSDLQEGTFTISNLGVFGVDSFTPIINPPQVAILGVNRIKEEPQRTETGIEFRKQMGFSLSFDHRVIDGADAARFLQTLAETLEDAPALPEN